MQSERGSLTRSGPRIAEALRVRDPRSVGGLFIGVHGGLAVPPLLKSRFGTAAKPLTLTLSPSEGERGSASVPRWSFLFAGG